MPAASVSSLAYVALPAVSDRLWFFFGYLFVEALALPLGSTFYIAYLGARHPPLVVAIVGALGTAGGSAVQYLAVRWLLARPKHIPPWLARLRVRLETSVRGVGAAAFWTLFVIYATPLGAGPLKLVAAAAGYPLPKFTLAIGLGCLPYYFALAYLGERFELPGWVYVLAIGGVLVLGVGQWLLHRRRGAPEESS